MGTLLDKNGNAIKPGQLVRLCQTHKHYMSEHRARVADYDGVLYLEHSDISEPLSFYRNGNTDYHAVEIL